MSGYCAIFPGQGSQNVGMGSEYLKTEVGKKLFREAGEVLGFDIQALCMDGPLEILTLTSNSQPAIFLVSYIAYSIHLENGDAEPKYTAGHSLGEYTALAASGVLNFEDGLKAVRQRGLFMESCYPPGKGAMAAVLGADPDELKNVCDQVSGSIGTVQAANFNCTGQIVISGLKEAVEKVLTSFRGKLLQVSSPFHCSLMEPAARKMEEYLQGMTFNDAKFSVVSNVDNVFRISANDFPKSLVEQITSSVLWDSGIHKIIGNGVGHFIEFGSGKVLTGMMKRIDKSATTENK